MEYVWKVTKLKRYTTDIVENAVIETYWEITGTDENGNIGTFSGTTSFDLDIDLENFIPYEELTEEQILSWIQTAVAGIEWQVEKSIADQIQLKKSTIVEDDENSFPWSNK
jgi:hypothetical protein